MESRFGHDFSRIRVHADAPADESARALHAHAYSVGSDVVFAQGRYAPRTTEGTRLLAHELTHSVQEQRHPADVGAVATISESADTTEREADRVAERVGRGDTAGPVAAAPTAYVHRASDVIGFFTHLFGQLRTFDVQELQDYLTFIDGGRIEGEMDSDDKAVQIVQAWKRGGSPYKLDNVRRAVIIKELLDGPTTSADEEAIVEVLERSDPPMLDKIFFAFGSPSQKQIAEDVPDDPESQLADFCRRRWVGGIDAFRKDQGEPRAQGEAIPEGAPLPKPMPGPPLEMPETKRYTVPSRPLFGGGAAAPEPEPVAPTSPRVFTPGVYPGTGTDILRAIISSPFGQRLKEIGKEAAEEAWDKSTTAEKVAFFALQLAPLGIGVYGVTFGGMSDGQRREILNLVISDKDNALLRPLPEKTITLLELLFDPSFKVRKVRPPVGEIDVSP